MFKKQKKEKRIRHAGERTTQMKTNKRKQTLKCLFPQSWWEPGVPLLWCYLLRELAQITGPRSEYPVDHFIHLRSQVSLVCTVARLKESSDLASLLVTLFLPETLHRALGPALPALLSEMLKSPLQTSKCSPKL